MVKRKVQAQRKFAQGAFIPPSSSSSSMPERRLDVPIKEPKIIYNSMSAKSLLDIVSLKTMHPHLQPYVLLERIEASANNDEVVQPILKFSNKLKSCMTSNKVAYDMRLRPRLVGCSNGIKIRKIRNIRNRKIRPNNVPSQFSIEDNKPLTYFATNQTMRKVTKRVMKNTSKDVTHNKRNRPSVRNMHQYIMTRSRLKPGAVVSASDVSTAELSSLSNDVRRQTSSTCQPFTGGSKSVPRATTSPLTVMSSTVTSIAKSKKKRYSINARNNAKDKCVQPRILAGDNSNINGQSSCPQVVAPDRTVSNDKRTHSKETTKFPSKSNIRTHVVNPQIPLVDTSNIPGQSSCTQITAPGGIVFSVRKSHNTVTTPPSKRKSRELRDIPSLLPVNDSNIDEQSSCPQVAPPDEIVFNDSNIDNTVSKSKAGVMRLEIVPLDQSDLDIVSGGEIALKNNTETSALRSSPLSTNTANDSVQDQELSEEPTAFITGVFVQNVVQTEESGILRPRKTAELLEVTADGIGSNQELPAENIPAAETTEDNCVPQFYGNAGIETWINHTSNVQSVTVIQTELSPREGTQSPPTVETFTATTNCPVKRLVTLKKFCSAINETIDYCIDCWQCKILKRLYTVTQKVRSPNNRSKDDIYDFDSLRDGIAEDPQMSLRERRRQRMSRSQEHAATDTAIGIGMPVYLDILPYNSPNLAKIIPVYNPYDADVTLRASLIDKAQAKSEKLYDLDALLEDVIQTLMTNPVPKENAENTPSEDFFLNYISDEESYGKSEHYSGGAVKPPKPTKRGFPKSVDNAMLVDAPIFHPTQEEFLDPIAYFEKIMPAAAKFGLCKVVAPDGFSPSCYLNENFKFSVSNQYIARLYNRWSPVTREMCAIKAYSASQNVPFNKAPLVEGLEINLPKLYHLVQRLGGLQDVIRKKRWGRVAEEMRFTKGPNPGHKLDVIYVKYLLPYDTLSHQERQKIMCQVEKSWQKKNQKMLERALNPLLRQKRLLGESDETESSDDDTEDEYASLADAEDCVVAGRPMNLNNFKKVASNARDTYFPRSKNPTAAQVEEEYWRVVLLNTDHVCVNSASIDTGVEGYGFSNKVDDPYSKHPWNLKVISNNSGNVLRSLGPVLGVTVPTLHLGMVFSTSCWHRDPHGLPWLEYLHNGPGKIWYGIPDEQSNNFRNAVEKLCPTSCQNKSIWLPSDITMIPPSLLLESNVSLSRVEQRPGEFIIVFPKAYSSSLSTGFTISESVYFATKTWLNTIHQVFQEARDSCEPTMFAVEQLLIAATRDSRAQLSVLQQVHSNLRPLLELELQFRRSIEFYDIKVKKLTEAQRNHNTKKSTGAFNVRDLDECQICRTTLYLSKVTGVTGKRSTFCLQHTLCLLEKMETVNPHNLELIVYYSNQELKEIIYHLQNRISPLQTHICLSPSPQPGPSTAS